VKPARKPDERIEQPSSSSVFFFCSYLNSPFPFLRSLSRIARYLVLRFLLRVIFGFLESFRRKRLVSRLIPSMSRGIKSQLLPKQRKIVIRLQRTAKDQCLQCLARNRKQRSHICYLIRAHIVTVNLFDQRRLFCFLIFTEHALSNRQ